MLDLGDAGAAGGVQELATLGKQAALSPGFIACGKTGRKEASKPALSRGGVSHHCPD